MIRFIFFFCILFVLILGCKDPDYVYSLNKLIDDRGTDDRVLLIMNDGYYDSYTNKLHSHLSDLTSNLTYVQTDNNLIQFDFEPSDFDQIWIFDLKETEPTVNMTYILDQVVEWFQARQEKNVIFDSRFLYSLDYPTPFTTAIPDHKLIDNYYWNLKVRGGGLFIGVDNGPYYVHTSNFVLEKLQFSLFGGSKDIEGNRLEIQPYHPIAFYPEYGYTEIQDDKFYVKAGKEVSDDIPLGLQTNGIYLYTFGYATNIGGHPHITTSIPPSDFRFEKYFSCEQTLQHNDEWEIGNLVNYLSSNTSVQIRSNKIGTYFKSEFEGSSIMKVKLPKYPGEHELLLNLKSKNNQFLDFVFNVTVQLNAEDVNCDTKQCSCELSKSCVQEKDITVREFINDGYLYIDKSVTITVMYEPNTTPINSTNGIVEISGNLIMVVPDSFLNEKEETVDLLVGNYLGNFNNVTIESSAPLRSCENINSKANYETHLISVTFSLNDAKCFKWWMYLLIVLGCVIVIVAILLIVVYKSKKLKQRFLPFNK